MNEKQQFSKKKLKLQQKIQIFLSHTHSIDQQILFPDKEF